MNRNPKSWGAFVLYFGTALAAGIAQKVYLYCFPQVIPECKTRCPSEDLIYFLLHDHAGLLLTMAATAAALLLLRAMPWPKPIEPVLPIAAAIAGIASSLLMWR